MLIREPIVAGPFYPEESDRCRSALGELVAQLGAPGAATDRYIGGLVPHAGWMCSGRVAARVFRTLSTACTPKTVVLFGGVHRYRGRVAAMFSSGHWATPLGAVEVDDRLAERVLGYTNLIVDDPYAHEAEHSLEVQMPFVREFFPGAKVLPIMVPSNARSTEVGEAVARTLTAYRHEALVVGTTDLTHYGPTYDFTPKGVGQKGNDWAKIENDRRFIELVCALESDALVEEASAHKNACSSGAAAATLAACAALGATQGILLEHTTSSEVLAPRFSGAMSDSVGYAGIVFH